MVSDGEIREALKPTVDVIVRAVRDALERIPPELAADIFDHGVVLDRRRVAAQEPGSPPARGHRASRADGGRPADLGRAGAPDGCCRTIALLKKLAS